VPATHLSCTRCGNELQLEGVGVCPRCFGPLEPVYDIDQLRRTLTHESIEAGPPSLWRYAPLLPVEVPREPRLAPGLTPLVPATRLAAQLGLAELYLKLDTANPTHSFKDRVVAVACAKAQELGGPSQRLVDQTVIETRPSRARSARLCLDEAKSRLIPSYIDRRFTLYCAIRGRACPLRIKRG
jgi:threonine synthase